jgi:hypothetical protein
MHHTTGSFPVFRGDGVTTDDRQDGQKGQQTIAERAAHVHPADEIRSPKGNHHSKSQKTQGGSGKNRPS